MAEVVGSEVSLSPAERTKGELIAEIARFVLMPEDPEVQQIGNDGLIYAVNRLNYRTWRFTEALFDIDLVSNLTEYTGPANFHRPHIAVYLGTDGSVNRFPLTWVEPREFQELQATGSLSVSLGSHVYTVYKYTDDQKVTILGNITDQFISDTPTLRLRYHRYVVCPTSSAGRFNVPAQVENYLLWAAKKYTAAIIKPTIYPLAQTEENDAWEHLIEDSKTSDDF